MHMFCTDNETLDPVKAWAKTVQRVRGYEEASEDTRVCAFTHPGGKMSFIQADHVRTRLQSVVEVIGEETLGFNKDDIGMHSIRSGGAMAMFLSGTSPIIIKKIGRWSSEAFLEYIREQVEDFTLGVSKNMIKFEDFNYLKMKDIGHGSASPSQQKEIIDDEDGPDCVPFAIQFS